MKNQFVRVTSGCTSDSLCSSPEREEKEEEKGEGKEVRTRVHPRRVYRRRRNSEKGEERERVSMSACGGCR